MKITTANQRGFAWHRRAGIRVKGYLFDAAGVFRRGEKLLDYFSAGIDEEGFCRKLREANGCFAVIVETDIQLLAAVDPVRSMPLFYAAKNGDLVLGDDVYAIQQELGGATETDPVAREEVLRVGYTVGPRTIDPRVEQIEAGKFYAWDKKTARGSTRLFFSHVHGNYTDKSEDALADELDQITSRWARRLIESVEGRPIVIPLSGGYDSRSIACALKREGCANVICYSYGVPSSFEWRVARDVASRLGYPIHIVEYNRQNWKTTIESPRFLEFCRLSAQRCAVPCIQELPVREQLDAQKVLPANAVIVPGYCGDVLGGSFIPPIICSDKSKELLSESVGEYLLRTHFCLVKSPIAFEIKRAVLEQINDSTSQCELNTVAGYCSALEEWLTRNRWSKFIVNTVRTHESFGNEWRLPLWDNELIEWWYRIPLRLRVNSVFYHRFLFERLFEPMNVAYRKTQPRQSAATAARSKLPTAVLPVARWIYYRTVARFFSKQNDINAFDDAARILIKQLPRKWAFDSFGNINGVVGVWCDVNEL